MAQQSGGPAARPPSRASYTSQISRGGASIYSTGSVHSVRSTHVQSTVPLNGRREVWQPPILTKGFFTTIPKAANIVGIFSIIQSLFTIVTSAFDIYSLVLAEPGVVHTGAYFISYEFVYAGNPHVRNSLIVFSLFSLLSGTALLIASAVMLHALTSEDESRIRPWLLVMFIHSSWKCFSIVYFSIVNDLYYTYHGLMCFVWSIMILFNIYSWVVVWSFFNELSEVSKLEDIAHMKMGTMTSLNAPAYSHTPSVSVYHPSRPITPHSLKL